MADGILDMIMSSKKRKQILFLLESGPRTLSEIKEHCGVNSPSEIFPRVKELIEAGLVMGTSDEYRITRLGISLLKHIVPMLDFTDALDKPYWRKHDLSGIPDDLLSRIGDLNICKVMREEPEFLESNELFINACLNATSFYGGAHIFFKGWETLFPVMSKRGIPVEIITTKKIYNKIKDVHNEKLETYLKHGGKMYIAFGINVTFSVISGGIFQLSANTTTGLYDHVIMHGNDAMAIKWGNDLFNYYKENAIEIKSTESPIIPESCSRILVKPSL